MNYIAAIDQQVSALPPEYQREVLDFAVYLREKRLNKIPPAWLDQAWGTAPDFPDRPAQLPADDLAPL